MPTVFCHLQVMLKVLLQLECILPVQVWYCAAYFGSAPADGHSRANLEESPLADLAHSEE